MKPKILVIDDGIDTWRLLSSILSAHEYEPIWAADAVQAVSEARKHQPRVILLDLGLPGGDGFMVLQRLKANRLLAAIPVIVVTGQDSLLMGPKTRKLGAIGYVQKPVKAEELLATLRGVFEKGI